ncbi:hypothetical protein TNIN_229101 [Trichonephila inaurata madagascariensis]|uniref:Uncharacterized protein n=1 Tax=Trichonephila inaurata madagascariensis TaxID=2747483 RepID=A0A8X7C2I1_9ARAC|nr:hypothetical protein TNIN_229101 [Trichonephila inaurata madagascariensis]
MSLKLSEENVLTDLPDDQHSFSKDKSGKCVPDMHTQKTCIKELHVSPLLDHPKGNSVETRNSNDNIHRADHDEIPRSVRYVVSSPSCNVSFIRKSYFVLQYLLEFASSQICAIY